MAAGRTYEEAHAAALQAALAYRADLVRRGLLKTPGAAPVPLHRSDVPGVCWAKLRATWSVKIQTKGKRIEEYIKPEDSTLAAVERARARAEARRRELEAEHGLHTVVVASRAKTAEELVQRESGEKYISWRPSDEVWHVQVVVNGKNMNGRFRPKGFSPAEVEQARLEAVQYRDMLLRARGPGARPPE